MTSIEEKVTSVFSQVAQATFQAGRSEHTVKVIAVTKYVDSSITNQLIKAGVAHIGENRVDKFLEKYQVLKNEKVVWHLIGSLQRRKVKDVINYVDYFHALDSLKLALEIEKRAERPIKCFLQVNISKEESKHGFHVEELPEVLPQLGQLKQIQIVGLMTMAPFDSTREAILDIFSQTEALRQEIQAQAWVNMPMTEVSMGMSQDYDLAIQAGATFVRIGTAFFE